MYCLFQFDSMSTVFFPSSFAHAHISTCFVDTVVLSEIATCALVSSRLPLGVKGSALRPVIQVCDIRIAII